MATPENDNFSMDNAVSVLGAFRGELMRSEQFEDKASIQGVEVYDVESARYALQSVRSLEIPEGLEDLRWMTVRALQNAVVKKMLVA
jgi:hypothetical protein